MIAALSFLLTSTTAASRNVEQECFVGDAVKVQVVAHDDHEHWKATISSIASNGSMTVSWDDPHPDTAPVAHVPWDRVKKNHTVCVPPGHSSKGAPRSGAVPGSIVSSWSGKCLALPSENPQNGDFLMTWECDGSAGQKWSWDEYVMHWDGGVVWTHCLDIPFGDITNGNGLWLWACLGLPQQVWSYDEATKAIFLGEGGMSTCIDLVDGGVDDGTEVQIWDCLGAENMNQMWEFGADPSEQVV